MKKLFYVLFFTVFTFNLNAQCSIDYSQFNEVWRDDFDGTMADLEENWLVGEYSWGKVINAGEQVVSDFPLLKEYVLAKTDKNNVSLSGGKVHLKNSQLPTYETVYYCKNVNGVQECRDYRQKYTTSVIQTTIGEIFSNPNCNIQDKGGWQYGMFEVRCKIPSDEMMASAFWMTPSSAWPPELDIFEVDQVCRNSNIFNGGPNDCPENYDFHTSVGQQKNGQHSPEWTKSFHKAANTSFYDEYHTWSVLWTPDKIKFYLDGNEFRTWYGNLNYDGSPITCDWRRMKIILSTGNTLHSNKKGNENAFNPNSEFTIDWVKVYKPTSGIYVDLDESNLLAEEMEFNINDVEGNVEMFNNKMYYRNNINELRSVYFDNVNWKQDGIFNSFNQKMKGDPYVQSNNKIYFKDNQNELRNFYKSGGSWSNADISNGQKIKEGFYISKFGTLEEIVYTDLNRKIKHFFWYNNSWQNANFFTTPQQGGKANDNFIVTNDLIIYEGRKQIWPYWFRDKYLWVTRKGMGANGLPFLTKHKFPTKIYTQGTHTKVENFALSADEKKIFYITENNQLKYHEYNANTNSWTEDIEVDNYFYNVYDNLEVAQNGNKVFYTDNTGHIHNFYKSGGVWHNSVVNWNNTLDKDDINLLKYDENTGRLYYTANYTEPGLWNGWIANGELSYFEWSQVTGQWEWKKIVKNNNMDGADQYNGHVKSKVQILSNGELLYVDQENNVQKVYKPELCSELIYDHNTFIYGLGTNKNDEINVIENFLENPNTSKGIDGKEKERPNYMMPTDFNVKEYQVNNNDVYKVIKSVFPNPTSGAFTVELKDEAIRLNTQELRMISIVKPLTNEVIEQKIVNVSQKKINFNIATKIGGEYGIVVGEDGEIETNVLIKGN